MENKKPTSDIESVYLKRAMKFAAASIGLDLGDEKVKVDEVQHGFDDGQVDSLRKTEDGEEIAWLKQTCMGMPEQYEGETTLGRKIYVRLRWSYGRLDIDGQTYSDIAYHENMVGDFREGDLKRLFDAAGLRNFDDIEIKKVY